MNARALKMYLRARNYCLRAMEVRFPGIQPSLSKDPAAALAKARKSDVPLLYWTAASWGSAIALGLDRPELVADMPAVRALAERAIALDETWAKGALHEMFISLDSLSPALGGSPERARAHFKRAVELQNGAAAGPVRRPCRRARAAGPGRRGIRIAAEAGAGRRSGEGSVHAPRHARPAAPRQGPARPHRHAVPEVMIPEK